MDVMYVEKICAPGPDHRLWRVSKDLGMSRWRKEDEAEVALLSALRFECRTRCTLCSQGGSASARTIRFMDHKRTVQSSPVSQLSSAMLLLCSYYRYGLRWELR